MTAASRSTPLTRRRATRRLRPNVTAAARTGVRADRVGPTISRYLGRFDPRRGGDADARRGAYTNLVNEYYDLVTDFYEYGWGHSFHFAARRRRESFEESIRRHEHYLGLRLGATPGARLLDVGCGVGGPMRAIASFTGASVVGINNNAYQIERGDTHNADARLDHLCSFVKADFMAIPLDDESFDGAYAIEATCHAPDRLPVFSEIHRVLRPGRRFVGYEWCVTDRYDATNDEHRRVIRGIEEGDALPELQSTAVVDAALRDAGFELESTRDLAEDCDPETPWYLPLTGRDVGLRSLPRTRPGRALTHGAVRVLERLRLAPKGSAEVSGMLNAAADALVRGGELGIFTPMYFFVARKPDSPSSREAGRQPAADDVTRR